MEIVHAADLGDTDLSQLASLLIEAVDSGVSLTFRAPLDKDAAKRYWQDVRTEILLRKTLLITARDGGRIIGAVAISLGRQASNTNRAEVVRMLVNGAHRRKGVATALMQAAERTARALGRTLLHFDFAAQEPTQKLLQKLGYSSGGTVQAAASANGGTALDALIYYKRLA